MRITAIVVFLLGSIFFFFEGRRMRKEFRVLKNTTDDSPENSINLGQQKTDYLLQAVIFGMIKLILLKDILNIN